MKARGLAATSCFVLVLLIAGSLCFAGPGDLVLPELPGAASDTAKGVLDQLAVGTIPPVPRVVDGAGSAFVSGAQIPEPLTLTLLAIGGLALIRRRR